MPEIRETVICDAVRTPIGKRKGALANWHPVDLLAFTLKALVDRTGVDPGRVDDVIAGCVTQVGEQSTNVGRNGWVAAGFPQHVPGTTVDRQCGSSQQAMHFAAQGVMAGGYDLAIACGVEAMTRVPLASNAKGGDGPFPGSYLDEIDGKLWTQFQVANELAEQDGISREQMDEYSVESHRRAHENWENGHFEAETVPVPIRDEEGRETGQVLDRDEGIRPESTLGTLAGLSSAQSWDDGAPDITAGNSSQTSDGAAAMLIADRATAEKLGLPIRARFLHLHVGADDAVLVLSAPNPVTRTILERSGMKVDEFDGIECNEAFAAIALRWAQEFEPEPERFNPRGGAVAIGHPLGASGVRLMTTLLNHLDAVDGRYGFQTMCEGGGQANATVIERLP